MPLSVRQDGFAALEGEWLALLPCSATNTIFLTPRWQRTWWKHFGQGWDLTLLLLRDGDTTLGLAPLMSRGEELHFLGDTDLFDYQDFVVCRSQEERFYRSLWGHIRSLPWRTLDLRSLPEESPTLRLLPALAEADGCRVEASVQDQVPATALPPTWEEYLAGLGKKDRHELRRKIRRLEGAGDVRQYACTDPAAVSAKMPEFFRLLRASDPKKVEFLTPARERFFADFATDLAARGQFRLYLLEVDGVPAASCIAFDYDNAFLLYNSGYDPQYAGLSVGLLNKAFCIKDAIATGRRLFDFLRGEERYKYDLGGRPRAVRRIVVRR